MDPFSITVGIISLVGLTAHTLHVTHSYINEAKHGREAAVEMSNELDVLNNNLSRLRDFLRKDSAIQPFDNTSVLVSSLSACRERLTRLSVRLESKEGIRYEKLKWPFDVKEHRKTISELRAFAQWIQFALTIDGCALLAKTSTDVLTILKHQLETFQSIESLDRRTHSIKQSMEEQAQLSKDLRAIEEREKLLEWISPIRHEQKHHDVRVPRVEGTGQWLLQKKEFQSWRDEPSLRTKVLWAHGIQGSGKSVLSSLVIDHLRDTFLGQNVAIAHLYFDYQNQEYQTSENVIASILKQLTLAKSEVPQLLGEIHQRLKGQGRRPLQQDLEQATLAMCSTFNKVFVVIDALDECDATKHRPAFINFLDRVSEQSSSSIFVTSRPGLESTTKILTSSIKITIEADDSDLKRYVSEEIERSDAVDEIDESFKCDIIEKVAKCARKMFLLAVLQVQAVLQETSIGEMEEALEVMPSGLDEAFEETLQRIQQQPEKRRMLGMSILMWISHARRPLKVAELSEALAVKVGETSLNPKFSKSQKLMVACCLGLVIVDENSSVIRLVHYSVQEFFREHHSRVFPSGKLTIAKILVSYLLSDPFSGGPRQDQQDISALISTHPFVQYVSRHWGFHVRDTESRDVNALILRFLHSRPHRACSVQISEYVAGRREEYWKAEEAESRNELHVAAKFGLEDIATQVLDSGECAVDCRTEMGTTALILASSGGHRSFVRMLLNRQANVSLQNWYGTALHCAAEAGKTASIAELLDAGLDVDIRDKSRRTALHCATVSGYPHVMRLLLKGGAQVDAICDQHYTSLRYAVVWEHSLKVIRTLLENGADTETRSHSGLTVLHHAAVMDLEEVLALLLHYGAEIDATDSRGNTALHLAAERNYAQLVNILLRRGASIDAQTHDGVTPLYLAAECGAEQAFDLLEMHGAKTDIADEEGLMPLHVAVKENHLRIVRNLLEAGADVNAPCKDGGKALDFAIENKHDSIVQILLQSSAGRQAGFQDERVGQAETTKDASCDQDLSEHEMNHTTDRLLAYSTGNSEQ